MNPSALWWHPLENDELACELCPVGCRLSSGQDGPCGSRGNRAGTMVPLHYGRIISAGMDPIEKKPLYHYYPGSSIFSVAAPGCNLHCLFCQNWQISQTSSRTTNGTTNGAKGREVVASTTSASAAELVDAALRQGASGIAYTYSEPLVWYEFIKDCAALAKEHGLKNVLVTNGFLNPRPLADLLPLIDAANIDLKAMDPEFYRDVCQGSLEPVLAAIRQFHAAGVHLEVTNLLIPGYNDSEAQVDQLVDFVGSLGPEVPLHFSAYRPSWKLDAPPTPRSTLIRAREQALQSLDWVYLGNVGGEVGRDTVCPDCGSPVVIREGFRAEVNVLSGGLCSSCGRKLPIITA
ncbi:MAG: AmmeMemoRadiSam system radical SAM enzyme [Gemmatimonadales bacterium]|nr:AmmeMemoRadiSam system radical SAM enzyme [Gemmatimonadales bacterium]